MNDNSNSNTDIVKTASSSVSPIWGKDIPHEDIEPLIKLLLTVRLNYLRDQSKKELEELKNRQAQVTELHKLLQTIKTTKSTDGALDFTNNEELKGLVEKAKELGVKVKDSTKLSKEECNDLIENIRMTVEDLNVKNDMQLQTVTRLTNETYESYQLARSIMKPLHDDLLNKARAMGGGR